MPTFSTVSVSLILVGEGCQRAMIFNIELKKEEALSQAFMSLGIISGHMFEHMSIEPVIIQKLDARVTLLVLPEIVDDKRISATL